ncbi:MAG: S8 family peptidase [Candidatus Nitrosotenuis sp.]
MKLNLYLMSFLIASLVLLSIMTVTPIEARQEGKRVLAHTDDEVNNAVSHGCKLVRETKGLKALSCDPLVADSLGLQEDIQLFAVDSSANTQIGADTVQNSGNTGANRKIVVLDTGYNYNHPELSSSYLGGKDFVNNDFDPVDDNGHGSHVAGIITADGIDPKARGVAPSAGIISGKVLDAAGSGYFSDTVAAIYWAVDGPDGIPNTADDFGADAISLSLGSSPPYTYKGFCDNVMPDMTNAIKYALSRGIIVIVAAGNSGGSGVSLPGCISYSTTIAAVDSTDKIASFSGRGNAVDVSSPGVSIYSTWLGASYATASGTSMATPVTSGTVALIKSAHPEYTPSQIQNALVKTAKDLGKRGFDTSYGWGRINAANAVNYIQ